MRRNSKTRNRKNLNIRQPCFASPYCDDDSLIDIRLTPYNDGTEAMKSPLSTEKQYLRAITPRNFLTVP